MNGQERVPLRASKARTGGVPRGLLPGGTSLRLRITAVLALVCAFVPAAAAQAGPVATSDAEYSASAASSLTRSGGCQHGGALLARPPRATCAATQFISSRSSIDALTYMNQKPEWQRYLEVWPLDTGEFDGNNLGRKEFTPNAEYKSAGLPTTTLDRNEVRSCSWCASPTSRCPTRARSAMRCRSRSTASSAPASRAARARWRTS